MVMKRVILAALLLAVPMLPRAASADAIQDTKDIRAGKLPVRYDWLGWDGTTAHLRTLVCSAGGTTSCTASIVKQSDLATSRIELLSIQEVYCDGKAPCAALDSATAANFVGREKAVTAALAALTPGTPVTDPLGIFGAVAGEATRVAVRVRDVSQIGDPNMTAELVLEGKGGATQTLGTLGARVFRLNSSTIQGAHLSFDGRTAAYVVETGVGVMCWDFSNLSTVVVNVPRQKASLANTIGWKAYRKGDMSEALARFTESTTLDASYALGWYNRASVESRNLDLGQALTSFEVAQTIDASLSERACRDPDFKPLRASRPSLFGCGSPAH